MENNSEFARLSKEFINTINNATTNILSGVKETLFVGLNWTADRFENLSDEKFLQIQDLPIILQKAGTNLQNAAESTSSGLNIALDSTTGAFKVVNESIDIADDYIDKAIFENKVISSVIGNTHDNLLSFSKINLSLRYNHEDVSVEEYLEHYKKSGFKKAVLYIPGLFCDEKLFIKNSEDDIGYGDYFFNEGFYPFYIRYNQGAHISENGKLLFKLVEEIYSQDPEINLSIISYSQGGLVLRSALYLAKENNSEFLKKVKKVILISCPNGGSYIEKIGFWAGLIMQASPILPLKIVGFIGNLRSDAIKDLSHGVIREVDWKKGNQIARYSGVMYYGELEDLDVYQAYSFSASQQNQIGLFFGDGIIEKPSLESLTEIVFSKFLDKENRTKVVYESSHYQIINSVEILNFLHKILLSI